MMFALNPPPVRLKQNGTFETVSLNGRKRSPVEILRPTASYATAARFALTCAVAGKNYVGQFSVRCAVLWPSSKSFDLAKQRTRLVERQEVTSVFNGYGCCL